jgi:ribosome-associated protein
LNNVATPMPALNGAIPAPISSRSNLPTGLHRACLAAKVASENKGDKVEVFDLREITTEFDYFVLATGASRRQVHTIVEEVDAAMRSTGDVRMGVNGYEASKWVVQDYGDVMVHVFDADTRDYYRLEEVWADAKPVDWRNEIE